MGRAAIFFSSFLKFSVSFLQMFYVIRQDNIALCTAGFLHYHAGRFATSGQRDISVFAGTILRKTPVHNVGTHFTENILFK